MNVTLKIWRQESGDRPGAYAMYEANDISPEMSFLEMLDIVNEQLIAPDALTGDLAVWRGQPFQRAKPINTGVKKHAQPRNIQLKLIEPAFYVAVHSLSSLALCPWCLCS